MTIQNEDFQDGIKKEDIIQCFNYDEMERVKKYRRVISKLTQEEKDKLLEIAIVQKAVKCAHLLLEHGALPREGVSYGVAVTLDLSLIKIYTDAGFIDGYAYIPAREHNRIDIISFLQSQKIVEKSATYLNPFYGGW